MTFSIPILIVLAFSTFATSMISGMMGMAGGFLLLVVLASLVETAYVVPLLSSVQLISNTARLTLFIKNINWKVVAYFLTGLCPGAVMGILIFQMLPKPLIKLMMGLITLVMIYLPKSEKESGLGTRIFLPVGFLAGLFGIFFGATGPLTAPFFIRNNIVKEELIATKATCQALIHLANLLLFGSIGFNVFANWKLLLGLAASVVIGTMVGKKMLHRLSFQTFIFWFKLLLTLIAVRIIISQTLQLINP
jgi:uncharacterized membrane protein YfcA